MKNILVFSASEDSKQGVLAAKYIEAWELGESPNPQDFISFNIEQRESLTNPDDPEEDWVYETVDVDVYDFKVVAKYPHVYARNGIQSVVTYRVTDAQEALIISLPNAIEILAECDGNPDSDYAWSDPDPEHIAKFRNVVGQDFFTGSGTIGEEDYIAPRKKLGVLA